MDGASFWQLSLGKQIPWRDALLYEYYWEWNYPMTPTIFAVRGQRYKYIRAHGVWDTDELYDLESDPDERFNLIQSQQHQDVAKTMKAKLFGLLKESGGLSIPLKPDRGRQFYYRNRKRSPQGEFPSWFYEKPAPVTE
jgi:N-acetylglucosamine-6-sulfatase